VSKVYVVSADYGYDGWLSPQAVFSDKAKAALWLHETQPYWTHEQRIVELELDPSPPQGNQP
jgi:hypothetical protein